MEESVNSLGLIFSGISALALVVTAIFVVSGAIKRPFQSINNSFATLEKKLDGLARDIGSIEQTQKVLVAVVKQNAPPDTSELMENIIQFQQRDT